MLDTPIERVVSRFRPAPAPEDPVYSAVPDDGLCLNAFVLLAPTPGSGEVLLGRVDPNADWAAIGGVTAARMVELSTRWMLPSRQLFRYEPPAEAAQRILAEQLQLPGVPLEGPFVFSEAWQRPKPVGTGRHWDLHFVFRGVWPRGHEPSSAAWRRLEFRHPASLAREEVGRGHLDVLALAGYPVAPP